MENQQNIFKNDWNVSSMIAAPNPRAGLPASDRVRAAGYDVLNGIGTVDKWRREHPTQFRLAVMAGFTTLPFAISGVQHAFAQDMPTCDTVSPCGVGNSIYAGACTNPDGSFGQYCSIPVEQVIPTLPPPMAYCTDYSFQSGVVAEACRTQSYVSSVCISHDGIVHTYSAFGGERLRDGESINVATISSTDRAETSDPVTGAIVYPVRCPDATDTQNLWTDSRNAVATPLPTPDTNPYFPSGLPTNPIIAPRPGPDLWESAKNFIGKVGVTLGLGALASLSIYTMSKIVIDAQRTERLNLETKKRRIKLSRTRAAEREAAQNANQAERNTGNSSASENSQN